MLRKYQADSQQALDNLFNDKLIPFKLIAEKVTDEQHGEFTVHFYDSRLRSVSIVLKQGASFMDQTKAEVLARLKNAGEFPTRRATCSLDFYARGTMPQRLANHRPEALRVA